MKKILIIIGLILALVVASGISFWLGLVKASIESNCAYTEQIDYLCKVLVYRLERDEKEELEEDLKWFSANYWPGYEEQAFWELMDEYLEKDISRPQMFAVEGHVWPMGRQFEPTDENRQYWTLERKEKD